MSNEEQERVLDAEEDLPEPEEVAEGSEEDESSDCDSSEEEEGTFVPLIGQGYNLLTDSVMDSLIYEHEAGKIKWGMVVPEGATFRKVTQSVDFMEKCNSLKDMADKRMKNLKIDCNLNYGIYSGSARAGYTCSSDSSSTSQSSSYSYLLEERVFEVAMGNHSQLSCTPEFQEDVNNLPTTFDPHDEEHMDLFEMFFTRWGHYVITKIYGGGSVAVNITSSDTSAQNFSEMKADASAAFKAGSAVSAEAEAQSESESKSDSKLTMSHDSYTWFGGDSDFHKQDTLQDAGLKQMWRKSTQKNPEMLTTEMGVIQIYTAVGHADPERKMACHKAMNHMLEARKHEEAEEGQTFGDVGMPDASPAFTMTVENLSQEVLIPEVEPCMESGKIIEPAPSIEAGYKEMMSGSKSDGAWCGVAGVQSWSISGNGYYINVMFSIPYDQNLHDNWIGVGVSKGIKDFDTMYYEDEGSSAGFDRKSYPTLEEPALYEHHDDDAKYKAIAYLQDAHSDQAKIIVRLEAL